MRTRATEGKRSDFFEDASEKLLREKVPSLYHNSLAGALNAIHVSEKEGAINMPRVEPWRLVASLSQVRIPGLVLVWSQSRVFTASTTCQRHSGH